MGISLFDIPVVADLAPAERRDLARWIRSVLPRGALCPEEDLTAMLDKSPFAGRVALSHLIAVGWLENKYGFFHADTYARRVAAGAVAGLRMSLDEAADLAGVVGARAQAWHETGARSVRLLRVVLYGSAVRDQGNLQPDIGDLDLALEIQVDDSLRTELHGLPVGQRWRAAVESSGLADHMMQGDDRVTLAGSLARVLRLFNRQMHGLDIPADGRSPSAVVLWACPGHSLPALRGVPSLMPDGFDDELAPCSVEMLQTLTSLQARTFIAHSRAHRMAPSTGKIFSRGTSSAA